MKVSLQITPSRIRSFDQVYLPRPVPLLDPLFAKDRFLDIRVQFKPYQVMDAISLGKTVCASFTMLSQSADEIVRNASVERTVWAVCEDVGETGVVAHVSPLSRG
jgi:hypothetical protein